MVKHNITPTLENITRHLTGVQKIIISSSIIMTLILANIIFNIAYSTNSSALTYQDNTNVSFTFAPTASVSLSSSNSGNTDNTDLTIDNLVPGSSSDSNVISITTATNSGVGYYLYVNVGSNDSSSTYYDTNDLINSGINGSSNVFTSLTSNAASLSAIPSGYWGYSYCLSSNSGGTINDCTDNTNWISGSSGNTSTGYNGLPKSTSGNGITLLDTSSLGSTTLDFKIAASSSSSQVSGAYSNIINFTIVPKELVSDYTITYNTVDADHVTGLPSNQTGTITTGITKDITLGSSPVREHYDFKGWCTVDTNGGKDCSGVTYNAGDTYILGNIGGTITIPLYAMWIGPYIQDITLQDCQVNVGLNNNPENIGDNIKVYDKRDNNDYTVRYINGECWMTQNLRFTDPSLEPSTSNVTTNTTMTYYSLDASDTSYANHCDGTNGYNYACIKNSGNTTTGVWYNYAAASAGTITTNSNTTPATSSICPAGWRLPSGPNAIVGTDFNKLIGNVTDGWQVATIGLTAFDSISSGMYGNGSIWSSKNGYWWSAITVNNTLRYILNYDSVNNGQFFGGDGSYRHRGFSIRCVRSS